MPATAAHAAVAAPPVPGEQPKPRHAGAPNQPRRSTLLDQLAGDPSGKFGRVLNQLQVLGMDSHHLEKLQVQLSAALGDDTGKKLRILQQAIQRIIQDKTYPPLPASPEQEARAPADEEWVQRQAKLVQRYSSGDEWREGVVPPPPRRDLLEGDDFHMMHGGEIQHVRAVVDSLHAPAAGRPMLSAAVMRDAPAFVGATQLGVPDELGAVHARAAAPAEQGAAAKPAAEPAGATDVPRPAAKRFRRQDAWAALNASLFHPEQNRLGEEMLAAAFGGGRGDFPGLAPQPGTEFWRCLLLAETEPVAGEEEESCGARLVPHVRLQVPETVAHADGLGYCAVHTGADGTVRRQAVGKDEAWSWLLRRREQRLAEMDRREPGADAGAVPLTGEAAARGAPRFVVRKGAAGGGAEVRVLMTDLELKAALAETSSTSVVLWQGYVRSQGEHARVFRCLCDLGRGRGGDPAHFVLAATATMGNAEGRGGGGWLCNTHDLGGVRATGRATMVAKVVGATWREQRAAALGLAQFALASFPFRRDKRGVRRQALPRMRLRRMAVDFLVDRDGRWWFSQVAALRVDRPARHGGAPPPAYPAPPAPSYSAEALRQHVAIVRSAAAGADAADAADEAKAPPEFVDEKPGPGPERDEPPVPVARAPSQSAAPATRLLVPAVSLGESVRVAARPRLGSAATHLVRDAVGAHLRLHAARGGAAAAGEAARLERRMTALALSQPGAENPLRAQVAALRERLGEADLGGAPPRDGAAPGAHAGRSLSLSQALSAGAGGAAQSFLGGSFLVGVESSGKAAGTGLLSRSAQSPAGLARVRLRPASAAPAHGHGHGRRGASPLVLSAAAALGHPI